MRKNLIIKQCILTVFLLFLCGCTSVHKKMSQISTEETELLLESEISDTEKYETTETMTEPELQKEQSLRFVDAWGEWFETTIDPELKMHNYDWNCLKNEEDNIRYEGDPSYTIRKGIDVSHHQNTIHWEKVKAAGYEFAFIRMVYRGYGEEGSLNLDRNYYDNILKAKDAGVKIGVYVFSQAVNESEAVQEAEMVIEHLNGISLDLPVVYDPELIRDDEARTDEVTGEQFTKNTIAFCEKIKDAGYEPMIYSNMYWEAFLFDLKQLQDYPVWYADYEKIPQTPYDFTFWQYSESGHVDGIEGETDLNVWFVKSGG